MSKQKVNCAKGTREADLGHAVLSASGSHRWLNCTPSARLELEFENTTSEAAREGTAAHALCEHKVSLLEMKVDEHKCVSCGKCAKVCKMDVDVTKRYKEQ